MRLIVCEDCGKRYDYGRDDFCPRCGAFNPPVKTWGMDAQGNVVRVDGINERNHGGSFVHSEVHREKHVRQARGMDWSKPGKSVRQPQPTAVRPARKGDASMAGIKTIFWIIGILTLLFFLLPLIAALL